MPVQCSALVRRIAWEFDVRQPHTLIKYPIGAHGWRCFEPNRAGGRSEVVLLNTVTADPEPTHQHAVPIKRKCAGEEDNAVLIFVVRFRPLRACMQRVEFVE